MKNYFSAAFTQTYLKDVICKNFYVRGLRQIESRGMLSKRFAKMIADKIRPGFHIEPMKSRFEENHLGKCYEKLIYKFRGFTIIRGSEYEGIDRLVFESPYCDEMEKCKSCNTDILKLFIFTDPGPYFDLRLEEVCMACDAFR